MKRRLSVRATTRAKTAAPTAGAARVPTEADTRAGKAAIGHRGWRGALVARAVAVALVARAVAVAGVAAVALGGCGLVGADSSEGDAAVAATPPAGGSAASARAGGSDAGSASGSAVSGFGSVKDAGDLPDPCTLLSKAEVTELTGRAITQIDEDGAQAGDLSRFCQWQQDGGQLALFLARTTDADFTAQIAEAKPVDGVGEEAFVLSGHLYVLYGSVQIDVYSRGGTDAQNLTDAKEVAKVVMPRI